MSDASPTWGAGIVNHGAYADLARCLESLASQSHPPAKVFVYDTGVDPDRLSALRPIFPEVDFESGPNVGYAGGGNRVVERLRSETSPDFMLVLNPDVVLDPTFAARLIESVMRTPRVAIASGKLLRPDRQTLDSAGIVFPRHRRPRDRGSEQPDLGQFDLAEHVDAASGAAMLLRVQAIEDLMVEGELFDERFFAYHEDTDLCWRARRFGYEVLYEPAAVAVHARGWQKQARRNVPSEIRRHSFKNHYLQVVKNEKLSDAIRNAPFLVSWEILRLGFVILRDPEMLGAYRQVFREWPEAWRKRKIIRARAGRVEAKSAARPDVRSD